MRNPSSIPLRYLNQSMKKNNDKTIYWWIPDLKKYPNLPAWMAARKICKSFWRKLESQNTNERLTSLQLSNKSLRLRFCCLQLCFFGWRALQIFRTLLAVIFFRCYQSSDLAQISQLMAMLLCFKESNSRDHCLCSFWKKGNLGSPFWHLIWASFILLPHVSGFLLLSSFLTFRGVVASGFSAWPGRPPLTEHSLGNLPSIVPPIKDSKITDHWAIGFFFWSF